MKPKIGTMIIVLHMDGFGHHPVWKETFVTNLKGDTIFFHDPVLDIMGDISKSISEKDYSVGWFFPEDNLPVIHEHLDKVFH